MKETYNQYWFTADEHYFHRNIIKYCDRPFDSVEEMNQEMIDRFNSVVGKDDITIHAGDFGLGTKSSIKNVIAQLNGSHTFLLGSHDRWLNKNTMTIYQRKFNGTMIVVCHYCMRTWALSHYNSWHLYGHSHGTLPSIGKSMDIGVDTNNFFPYSLNDIERIMKDKPDNPNKI